MKEWPQLKTMFLETKNATINRNLQSAELQSKRCCSLPWNILPSSFTVKFTVDLPEINTEDIIYVLDLQMSALDEVLNIDISALHQCPPPCANHPLSLLSLQLSGASLLDPSRLQLSEYLFSSNI